MRLLVIIVGSDGASVRGMYYTYIQKDSREEEKVTSSPHFLCKGSSAIKEQKNMFNLQYLFFVNK